jgi:DNA polymerase III alpha subunit
VGPLLKQQRDRSCLRLISSAADEYGGEAECGLLRHRLDRRAASAALSPARTASDEGTDLFELRNYKDGEYVRAAGCVIARQRPGTAKGFIFLSMEDETGIANVIITPDLYERERLVVTRSKFVLVEGALQNQDGVIQAHQGHSHDFRIQPRNWPSATWK